MLMDFCWEGAMCGEKQELAPFFEKKLSPTK